MRKLRKELPQKWKEHVRKMTEYAQKSNQMIVELQDYLIKKGLTNDTFESNCAFEDNIIDTTQHSYNWESLVHDIELALNDEYADYIEQITEERIAARRTNKEEIHVYKRCSNPTCRKTIVDEEGMLDSPLQDEQYYCSEDCLKKDLELISNAAQRYGNLDQM